MSTLLSHSPAEIIQRLLIDLEYGTEPTDSDDWPIFIGNEPAKPDNTITIYDTVGQNNGRNSVTGHRHEYFGIQIRVRGSEYKETFKKINDIANGLDVISYENVSISSSNYLIYTIIRVSNPVPLGLEKPTSSRRIFTINCVVSLMPQ